MRNKQAIIGIIFAAIILIGGIAVFNLSENKTNQPNNITAASNTTNTSSQSAMASSIKDIFGNTKNQKCDFNVENKNGGGTSGTVYTSDNNSYGEFVMNSNGKNSKMYLIRNDENFYIWGDSLPIAVKMSMSVDDMSSKMAGNAGLGNLDPNQKVDLKCTSWTVDTSKFIAPTNIKFMDATSMMGGSKMPANTSPTKTPNTTGASNECSLCNSLTGQAKSACMTAYKCQ